MHQSRKSVLVLSFSDLDRDPRVSKQIDLLNQDFFVVVAGTKYSGKLPFISLQSISRSWVNKITFAILLKLRLFGKAYWSNPAFIQAENALKVENFDYILANDLMSLPLAIKVKKKARIIFDAHEYSPLEFEESKIWKFLFVDFYSYLLKKYLPEVYKFTTVCEGISQKYYQEFGFLPEVFMNTSQFLDIKPRVIENKIKLICHSAAIRSRKIEILIEMAKYLDDQFELNLVLVPSQTDYYHRLVELAKKVKNVNLLPPVPLKDISRFLNNFDVGIYSIEPSSFNNKYSLPNKFFEFIQARLAIVIGPSPEMQRIVLKENIGMVSKGFEARELAMVVNSLSVERIMQLKENVNKVAFRYSTENNWEGFKDLLE